MTSGYAQINVQGPKSRDVMQAVTTENMSNEAFPFRAAREIEGASHALSVSQPGAVAETILEAYWA